MRVRTLIRQNSWKTYPLPKSFGQPVLQRQFPAVTFDNLLGNCEAKTRTGPGLAPRRIDPKKGFEYA